MPNTLSLKYKKKLNLLSWENYAMCFTIEKKTKLSFISLSWEIVYLALSLKSKDKLHLLSWGNYAKCTATEK